jgi:hypothetical protein
MSVHARTLVVSGVRRVASPAGVALFAAFVVSLAVFNAALNTVLTAAAGTPLPTGGEVAAYGVVLPVHPAVALLVAAGALVAGSFVVVVGSRLLLGSAAPRWSDPVECLTHRVVPATAVVLVAGVATAVAVAVGTVVLVVPGLVLAGHLLVFPVVLAVEDVGLVAGLRESLRRAADARVELTAATLGLVVPASLLVVGASVSYVLPTTVEFGLGVLGGAALLVAWLGVAAEAYRHLGAGSTARARNHRSRRASRAL